MRDMLRGLWWEGGAEQLRAERGVRAIAGAWDPLEGEVSDVGNGGCSVLLRYVARCLGRGAWPQRMRFAEL